jgi:hypothetical protein
MPLVARNVSTGAILATDVAVADTRETRRTGLLKRTGLNAGEALWIVPCRGVHTIGMKFTIDIVALDEKGTVIDRVSGLPPWRIRLPRRGTAGVLELTAGALESSGTQVGHRIEFEEKKGDHRR